ncbi:hypothetical protein [Halopiger aswanensis]|uniref:Uncharacterized protein n=1 Tax=Halopiger aswanensis TaxID=148449 RepID=A0A3R7DF33_9EURY|nr:hypothetical protein [Halopiger aswanensis]RKD97612.1 hypothetical protein ATJ93_0602 [Halopiger aswanensis]
MSAAIERARAFRGSRRANAVASVLLLVAGLYNLLLEEGTIFYGLGAFFLVVGLLGLYKLFAGESLTETVAS